MKKSDVIEISFRHPDPELAAQIVNKLATVFLDEHLIVHKNMQSYDFFENQSMILKTKLELSEEALKTFKKEQNVTAINEEQRLLLGQLADLRVDLNKTISQEVETKNRIIEVNNQISLTPKTISQGDEIDHNPLLISRLAEKLIELQIQEQSLLLKYTPENRLVQNVREEVQIVQNKLKEQEQKRYGKSNFGPNLLHQSLQEILYKNQADQKALSAKKEVQVKQLEDYKGKIKDLNKIEVKLDQLKQAVDVNRQNYRLYLAKFEESRISDEMDSKKMSNVSMMGKALPPIKPVSPKILLNILLGLLMGGAGGLIFAFVTEYLDDSLENPEEVEEALSVPVLASIVEF
ncbi:MAG: hypothetical protein GY705_07180 [Bacteroidetes bacterium]|nr:hypothetical protein [Bacteroidota bacterium]